MKIRSPWLIRLTTKLGTGVLGLWVNTLRGRVETFAQQTDPGDPTLKERYIYAFWHDSLFCVTAFRSIVPVTALISQSADGELISQFCHAFGINTIRGSSSHGGLEAANELIEASERSHLLVAPDGPRGPRREVKRGLVYLASWTKLRIVPMGVGFGRAWRAKSWDRTSVPLPFSTISVVAGPIIQVPVGLGKGGMEHYRKKIEDCMLTATGVAEAWAEGRTTKAEWPGAFAASA